jgi:two-component system response regulator FlrC
MPTNAKILVVEDDAALLDLLVDTLSTIGYSAVPALGGPEALVKLEQDAFDLVISDIKMPEVDGISLLNKVRQAYPGVPVLLITGVASDDIISQASPDGFLAKPFRIGHMEELIESTLSGGPPSTMPELQEALAIDEN